MGRKTQKECVADLVKLITENPYDEELEAVATVEVQKYNWTRAVMVRIDIP